MWQNLILNIPRLPVQKYANKLIKVLVLRSYVLVFYTPIGVTGCTNLASLLIPFSRVCIWFVDLPSYLSSARPLQLEESPTVYEVRLYLYRNSPSRFENFSFNGRVDTLFKRKRHVTHKPSKFVTQWLSWQGKTQRNCLHRSSARIPEIFRVIYRTRLRDQRFRGLHFLDLSELNRTQEIWKGRVI